MNIGAAWPRRSGEKGLSVKLTGAYAYGPPVRKGPPREAALSLSVG